MPSEHPPAVARKVRRRVTGMLGLGEYVFDLTKTDIDMCLLDWSRAAFVTCSPDVAP